MRNIAAKVYSDDVSSFFMITPFIERLPLEVTALFWWLIFSCKRLTNELKNKAYQFQVKPVSPPLKVPSLMPVPLPLVICEKSTAPPTLALPPIGKLSSASGLSGAGAGGKSSSAGVGSRITVSCSGAGVSVWVVFPPLELVDSDSEVEGDSSSTTGFSLERYWDATNPSPDSECSTLYQFPSSVKPVTWNWN